MSDCTCSKAAKTYGPQVFCFQCAARLTSKEKEFTRNNRDILCNKCEGEFYIAHTSEFNCLCSSIK